MIDGVVSKPLSAVTLPPLDEKTSLKEDIVITSRNFYVKKN
jgi:hypothetical protein